jgi:hypothetical protein
LWAAAAPAIVIARRSRRALTTTAARGRPALRCPGSTLPLRGERRPIGDHRRDGEHNGESAGETHVQQEPRFE